MSVVIVGGGIAGLEAALTVESKGKQVKLIDPGEEMVFYPSLHKVLEKGDPSLHTIEYDRKFEGRDIEHIKAKMEGLNTEEKVVETNKTDQSYDELLLAVGARTCYFDVDLETEVQTLRFKDDAVRIKEKLEKGEIDKAVVVGGGATGVEATASFTGLDKDLSIDLVHSRDRLLPDNSESTAKKAEEVLKSKNVNLRLGSRVSKISEGSVELQSGESIESDLTVWAGGISKNKVLEDLEIALDERGVLVDKSMKVKGYEDIFAAGDCVSYEGKATRAYYAIKEAKLASKNILRQDEGKKLKEMSSFWDPQIIYLGGRCSVMQIGERCFEGFIPHLLREYGVEKRYMVLRNHIL